MERVYIYDFGGELGITHKPTGFDGKINAEFIGAFDIEEFDSVIVEFRSGEDATFIPMNEAEVIDLNDLITSGVKWIGFDEAWINMELISSIKFHSFFEE